MNLIKLAKELNYLTELDDSRGAIFPKDHPLYDPNFPGIEDSTSQAIVVDGKEVDTGTIELDGTGAYDTGRIGIDDALPDIFASAAQFTDGTELNDEQLSKLTDNYPETIEQITTGQMEEGTCGYAPGGEVDVRNTDQMSPASPDLIRRAIRQEIKKLSNKK